MTFFRITFSFIVFIFATLEANAAAIDDQEGLTAKFQRVELMTISKDDAGKAFMRLERGKSQADDLLIVAAHQQSCSHYFHLFASDLWRQDQSESAIDIIVRVLLKSDGADFPGEDFDDPDSTEPFGYFSKDKIDQLAEILMGDKSGLKAFFIDLLQKKSGAKISEKPVVEDEEK